MGCFSVKALWSCRSLHHSWDPAPWHCHWQQGIFLTARHHGPILAIKELFSGGPDVNRKQVLHANLRLEIGSELGKIRPKFLRSTLGGNDKPCPDDDCIGLRLGCLACACRGADTKPQRNRKRGITGKTSQGSHLVLKRLINNKLTAGSTLHRLQVEKTGGIGNDCLHLRLFRLIPDEIDRCNRGTSKQNSELVPLLGRNIGNEKQIGTHFNQKVRKGSEPVLLYRLVESHDAYQAGTVYSTHRFLHHLVYIRMLLCQKASFADGLPIEIGIDERECQSPNTATLPAWRLQRTEYEVSSG